MSLCNYLIMEKLSMCRICLIKDVRLHCLVNTHLQEIYEFLSGHLLVTKDTRPLHACYMCCARLRNCLRLRTACLHSEELFSHLLENDSCEVTPSQDMSMLETVPIIHVNVYPVVHRELNIHPSPATDEQLYEELDGDLQDNITEQGLCSQIIKQEVLDSENASSEDEELNYSIQSTKAQALDNFCVDYSQNSDISKSNPSISSVDLQDICTKTVKIVLQRIDVNSFQKGNRKNEESSCNLFDVTFNKSDSNQNNEVEISAASSDVSDTDSIYIQEDTTADESYMDDKILDEAYPLGNIPHASKESEKPQKKYVLLERIPLSDKNIEQPSVKTSLISDSVLSNISNSSSDTLAEDSKFLKPASILTHKTKNFVSEDNAAVDVNNDAQHDNLPNDDTQNIDDLQPKRPKIKRARDKDYCFFCECFVLNFSRHLTRRHVYVPEVQKILAKPKKSHERKELIMALRKKGNFIQNSVEVTRPMRKQKTFTDYLPCTNCLGFYSKKLLWKHRKKCIKNSDKTTINVLSEAQNLLVRHLKVDNNLKDSVFLRMRADKISLIAKSDVLICSFGSHYMKTHREKHHVNLISRKMRELAKLLQEIKKIDPSIKDLFDALRPTNYDTILTATKIVGKYDSEKDRYESPTIAMNISTSIKQCCNIAILLASRKQGPYMHINNAQVEADLKTLIEIIDLNWKFDVSSQAASDLNTNKLDKVTIVSLASDLKILKEYVGEKCEEAATKIKEDSFNVSTFIQLLETIYCRVLLLNRRGPGILQRIKVHDYLESENATDNYEEFNRALTISEKILVKKFKRIVIVSECGRGVPVLFNNEVQEDIKLLLSIRDKFVSTSNHFLFGNPGSENTIFGYKVLRKYARQSGAKNPKSIISTSFRKHLASLSQIFSMSENDIEQLVTFMGHTNSVELKSYRLPHDVYQTAKISKLLILMEDGKADAFRGKSLDEIELDLNEQLDEGMTENDVILDYGSDRHSNLQTQTKTLESDRYVKKMQTRTLIPWTAEQKKVCTSFFKYHIKNKQPPKRHECEELKEKHPDLLNNKDWLKIKVFIQNTYTKKDLNEQLDKRMTENDVILDYDLELHQDTEMRAQDMANEITSSPQPGPSDLQTITLDSDRHSDLQTQTQTITLESDHHSDLYTQTKTLESDRHSDLQTQRKTLESDRHSDLQTQTKTLESNPHSDLQTQTITSESDHHSDLQTQTKTLESDPRSDLQTQKITSESDHHSDLQTQTKTLESDLHSDLQTQTITLESDRHSDLQTQTKTLESDPRSDLQTQKITSESDHHSDLQTLTKTLESDLHSDLQTQTITLESDRHSDLQTQTITLESDRHSDLQTQTKTLESDRYVKKKKTRTLIPWTAKQKKVCTSFFKYHIKNKQPPKKYECEGLKKKHPDLLHNKDWLKIKVFIQNTYTKKDLNEQLDEGMTENDVILDYNLELHQDTEMRAQDIANEITSSPQPGPSDLQAITLDSDRHSDLQTQTITLESDRHSDLHTQTKTLESDRHSDLQTQTKTLESDLHSDLQTQTITLESDRHSDLQTQTKSLESDPHSDLQTQTITLESDHHSDLQTQTKTLESDPHSDLQTQTITSQSDHHSDLQTQTITLESDRHFDLQTQTKTLESDRHSDLQTQTITLESDRHSDLQTQTKTLESDRYVKKKKMRTLIPWTAEQKKVCTSFFKYHIKNKQPPKKYECEGLKKKHPDLLNNKDWLKIKVFIQNTYTKKEK